MTATLEEQTVNPRAVYRLSINPVKANPRFLAQLFNSSLGKHLRMNVATGVTIQRVSSASLLDLELPIPDLTTQDRLALVGTDIGLLQFELQEMQNTLDEDWAVTTEVIETLSELKAILNLESRIANWWRELPYPLATIYRRYQVSAEPKEKLDSLLHFFEMAAIYLATVGTSYVRALRANWEQVIAKWVHPVRAPGIERSDFGFWINLAGASLKDVNRIASDGDLRAGAIELAGAETVQLALTIGRLGKAIEIVDVVRTYRNTWKGHGGHIKSTDAERLNREIEQSTRITFMS